MNLSRALLFSLIFSTNALHASDMKPGLWNLISDVKSKSGNVEKQLAAIQNNYKNYPPAQRKMVEDSMKEQGLTFNGAGNTTMACITKEQTDKLGVPPGLFSDCKQQEMSRSANYVKMKFTCKNATAEGDFKVTSPTTYTTYAVINTTLASGPEVITMTQTGKWLAADCGNIKPEAK